MQILDIPHMLICAAIPSAVLTSNDSSQVDCIGRWQCEPWPSACHQAEIAARKVPEYSGSETARTMCFTEDTGAGIGIVVMRGSVIVTQPGSNRSCAEIQIIVGNVVRSGAADHVAETETVASCRGQNHSIVIVETVAVRLSRPTRDSPVTNVAARLTSIWITGRPVDQVAIEGAPSCIPNHNDPCSLNILPDVVPKYAICGSHPIETHALAVL